MTEFHVVDGNHTAHRFHHSLSDFKNKDGQPVGVLVGVSAMLHRLVTKDKPDYLVFCFDSRCEWRRKLVPSYKAHRERNEDIERQILLLQELLELYGVQVLKVKGAEADDLIGTLTYLARDHHQVLVHTGDKDMNQLVRKQVWIQNPKGHTIDTKFVRKEYGISPLRFADYLALVGDKVDGFDGFVGCGAKGAKTLIEIATLKELLDDPKLVPVKYREEFVKQKKMIAKCRLIAKIKCDVKLPIALKDCKLKEPRWTELDKFFTQHGLNAAKKRIEPWLSRPTKGLFSK